MEIRENTQYNQMKISPIVHTNKNVNVEKWKEFS